MKIMSIFLLVILALAAVFPGIGYADNQSGEAQYLEMPVFQVDGDKIPYQNSPLNKLERGVVNMATFWVELPAEVARVSKEKDPAMGATVGVANGIFTSALRGVTGILDTVTFLIPSYTKPAMKPEYAIQGADEKIRAFLW